MPKAKTKPKKSSAPAADSTTWDNGPLASLGLCRFNDTWKDNHKDKLGSDDFTFEQYINEVLSPAKAIKSHIELIRQIKHSTLEQAKQLCAKYKFAAKAKGLGTVDKIYALAKWKLGVHVYPSCQFDKQGCKFDNVAHVNGLMVYDVQQITLETIELLKKWKHTAALHRSIGGGETDFALFLFCPGLSKETYTSGWNKGRNLLKQEFGIETEDTDDTKDVTRVRFLSYDPEAYYNYNAEPVLLNDLLISTDFSERTRAAIDKTINSENDWFRFGVSLAITKGEEGRELFHKISAVNSKKYSRGECDTKYDHALRLAASSKKKGITEGTFYWYLKKMYVDFQFPKSEQAVRDGKVTELSLPDLANLMTVGWRINELNDELVNVATGKTESEETIWFKINDHLGGAVEVALPTVISITRTDLLQRFNPLKDFLQGTEWDKVDHIKKFLECIPAQDKKIAELFLKTWLVACYRQGMYNKTNRFLLVLKGTENTGKSKALSWLCPLPEMLKVGPLETDNKDTRLSMGMFFMWNDDELKVSRVADFQKIKALISQETIVERAAYDRRQKVRPRYCNFMGSTNSDTMLLSTEENTRFLIIALEERVKFNWTAYEKIDKAQFWAQVRTLAESGWSEDVFEKQKEVNIENSIVTMAEEYLLDHYQKSPAGKKQTVLQLYEVVDAMQLAGFHNVNQHQVRELIVKLFGRYTRGYRAGEETKQVRGFPMVRVAGK